VRDEMRGNLITALREGTRLFPTIRGYDDTVLPELYNAIMAGHDIIFLGERGQAKTRLARGLVTLLDEWIPVVAGSEVNDDPFAPVSFHGKSVIAYGGYDTPISWVHRSSRFAEKLATPDTSVADLIGEVDPIKVAEGRYLSNEEILSFGLIPRTNRGIFNLNELPDLAERIQVGLLNILEERDIQIRGFQVRLPLDVMFVASANPEDYTNRGRIITPLKDRFG
jgi:magnesium chelatase subunit I